MSAPSPVRVSLFTVVAFTLVLLGLARAALLVTHEPALGYGDPSAWHRVAGCVGIAPIPPGTDAAGHARPSANYVTAGLGVGGCYPSSAALLAAPVVLGVGIASIASDEPEILVPLQAFGIFTLVITGALALAVAAALRPYPAAGIAHAVVFFAVIADPATTLWFNTLHPEPAALLGAYAVIAGATVIALRADDCPLFWWILGLGLAMLGLARGQFGLLPVALVLLAAPVLFRRSRRRAFAIAAVAIVVAVLQFMLGTGPAEESDRTRAEAHAGLLASVSSNPDATLDRLGLPVRCADMARSAWLVRPGPPHVDCPEADGVAMATLVQLAVLEPYTLLRAVSRVLVGGQSLVPGDLGIATEGPIASVQDLPARAMSFLVFLSRISAIAMATVAAGLLAAFPAAVVWLSWTAARETDRSAVPLAFSLLVAIAGYTLLTTTFGEGLLAAQRHDWLGEMALLVAVILIPWVLWQLTTDLLRARIAMAVLVGVVLLAAGWALWTQGQPLALGAIEKIRANGTSLEVTGWALDPWEIRRIYATVGGGPHTDAVRGTERRDIPAEFPGYPDADNAAFEILIPPNTWREGQPLSVFVENRHGAVTEIDRRIASPR